MMVGNWKSSGIARAQVPMFKGFFDSFISAPGVPIVTVKKVEICLDDPTPGWALYKEIDNWELEQTIVLSEDLC